MTFEHPLALALAPVLLAGGALLFAGGRLGALPDPLRFVERLWVDRAGLRNWTPLRRWRRRGIAFALAAALVAVALARPQWGETQELQYESAREVLVALDLSQSMAADDVKPSRLERAKLLVTSLLDALEGERVGLLLFAGTAFLQSPLSADYEVLRDLLGELDPAFLPEGGTRYGAMLDEALRSFGQGGAADRFLVVISDGEAHDEAWRDRIDVLREASVQVIGLGIGTPDGALVPDGAGGYRKDARGAVVLSRLESGTLRDLAEATGGLYRDVGAWADIAALVDEQVASGRVGSFAEERRRRGIERFQWALGPAVLLFLLGLWLELPLSPHARAELPARSGERAGAARIAAALLAAIGLAALPAEAQRAGLQPGADAGGASPEELAELVEELVGRPALAARDFARLAEGTVAAAPGIPAEILPGVVGDALAATRAGEHLDPDAADWRDLRARLRALRPPPPPPPSPSSGEQQGEESGGSGAQGRPESSDGQSGSASSESDSEAPAEPETGEDGSPSRPDRAGEPESADPGGEPSGEGTGDEPVPHEEAGLGEFEEPEGAAEEPSPSPSEESEPSPSSSPSSPPPPSPPMQQVGGESASPADAEGLEWASALGRIADVRDRDRPAVLYRRLNEREAAREDGTPGPAADDGGPDW